MLLTQREKNMPDFLKKHAGKLIFLVLVVVLFMWARSAYNQLVGLDIAVETQWAQVDNQYQRRMDLVPNLVSSVQGAMKQEKEVFKSIADARTRYSGAQQPSEKMAAANQFDTALARLLVVMENYPQLKSIDAVKSLMVQLEGTENRISVERKRYNDMVGEFNREVRMFPNNLTASMFGFKPKDFFKSKEGADVAPKVSF
jgi:LemA protein